MQRNKLERLARYVARPAIALERLSVDTAGRVVLELTHPFRDGTTHPRGSANRKRHQCKVREAPAPPNPPALNDDGLPIAPMTWAEPCDGHSRRVFLIDITACPACGGRLRWIAGGRLRMSQSPP